MADKKTGLHRIVVTYGDEQVEFRVEQDMTGPAARGQWEVLQQWSIPAPEAGHRRVAVLQSAREHGWMLPDGRWPAIRKGHRQVFGQDIWIGDHRRVIADVTARRDQLLQELSRVEELWRGSLHAGHAQGLRSVDLAAVAGVTSGRVRQILGEPATMERRTTASALQWAGGK